MSEHQTITTIVARGINQGLVLGEDTLQLGGHLLPRLRKPTHGHVAEADDDSEECVQVLLFFATLG